MGRPLVKNPFKGALLINGEIDAVTVGQLFSQLQAVKGDKVTIVFNSGGGSVEDGFALYSLIANSGLYVTGIAIGQVGSIAILPFLACDHRLCDPLTAFMIHHGTSSYPEEIPLREFKQIAQELDRMDDQYKKIIEYKTLLTDEELDEKLKFGSYFNSVEAGQWGFVHGFLGVK